MLKIVLLPLFFILSLFWLKSAILKELLVHASHNVFFTTLLIPPSHVLWQRVLVLFP